MNEEFKKIEANALIGISSSWGRGQPPGKIERIITQDGRLYYYRNYNYLTLQMKEKNIEKEVLIESKKLTDEEMNEVKDFIKNEIIGKNFENITIYDATYRVIGCYENQYFCIFNNIFENGIQNKVEYLFNKIEGGK